MTTIHLTKIFTWEQRPVLETRLDPATAQALLAGDGLPPGSVLDMDYTDDVDGLDRAFGQREPRPQDFIVQFSHLHPIMRVPYLVHTGYELPLMLDGAKPLSVFADLADAPVADPAIPPIARPIPQRILQAFAPHVLAGAIAMTQDRFRHVEPDGSASDRIDLFYTLPGEDWRVPFYRELLRVMRGGGWNEVCEQMQGLLLGYTPRQVQWWTEQRHGLFGPRVAPS